MRVNEGGGREAGSPSDVRPTIDRPAETRPSAAIVLGDRVEVSAQGVQLASTSGGAASLAALDSALGSVNQYRSTFGAIQNRLESSLRNLTNYTENLEQAKSRIIDADLAHETAQLAKFQILQESDTAVLGQANAVSQAALRLLG